MFNILGDVVMSGSRRLIEISNFNNDIYLLESNNITEKIIKY